eukprot:CAMPEP_0177264350 /NCGR_PEP_ID=MMETSP0367-20130122/61504_1 /TAXON_ID=447022 ORGANISM="Scrippsiella hangoei-like, Strain SHHI-4" /NCGR_SAMPLE_ID=MMETSP0367 /ASSEMBLY_ACC=CAM_ASM_000362 /LENGTH=52 /DNA_ID=CAMNT_0018719447 /DNA_START=177 /DNA_END=335 /DNA_ORIENTATION=-
MARELNTATRHYAIRKEAIMPHSGLHLLATLVSVMLNVVEVLNLDIGIADMN